MRILKALGTCALTLVLATPLAAEKLSLGAISKYLNDLKTAQGEFTQINDDGTISTGQILIKRPGRMRFEYNAPDSTIVVAGNNAVVIVDKKSNQGPETYPLRRTPLSIILARTVDLAQNRMVTGHTFDGTATVVTAQDPNNPDIGTIQMLFTANPVELRQWVINDGNGISTTMVLGALDKAARIANSKFDTARLKRELQ
ncbi:MAG: outer membrane lipoprotein carrier protein LolA [Paracoccaceae bacterium]